MCERVADGLLRGDERGMATFLNVHTCQTTEALLWKQFLLLGLTQPK
jgi:hypothetical protein